MKVYLSHMVKLSVLACIAMLAASCDVHEFPATKTTESTRHEVTLNLDFSTIMPLYKEEVFSRSGQLFDMYYHVEAYRIDANGKHGDTPDEVVRFVSEGLEYHNQTITMSLESGTYQLLVWAHYVEDGDYLKYFVFDDLREVSITDTKAESGNSNNADAFRSIMTIDVHSQSREFDVPMTRPVAKYELRATDLQNFMSRSGNADDLLAGRYTAVVRYTGYVPSLYSMVLDNTIDSRTNMSYKGSLTILDDSEVVIGFDYLFINPYGGGVTLRVDIYDGDGNRVAGTSQIDVPLKQAHLTVMRGEFFSKESNGLGINSEFIGPDYNIRL